MSIDKNGDRRADFSLLDLEPNSQTFRDIFKQFFKFW